MEKLVTKIKKLEIDRLVRFLDENPSKDEVLRDLNNEKDKISKQLSKLKEPVKNYSNFDRLLMSRKYANYQKEHREYINKVNDLNCILNEYTNKIKMIETDQEYDNNRVKVTELIPLVQSAKTIEEVALYTFCGTLDVKSSLKYLIAIVVLFQSIDIIKTDSDIDKVYNGLDTYKVIQKLEDVNLDSFIRNLKKVRINIDDGFYQFIMMIINDRSVCSQVNLMASFPILKQLKEDKGVPKNIRVALENLDNNKNENKTIHEIGCEIFLKEIFYKIKENLNV